MNKCCGKSDTDRFAWHRVTTPFIQDDFGGYMEAIWVLIFFVNLCLEPGAYKLVFSLVCLFSSFILPNYPAPLCSMVPFIFLLLYVNPVKHLLAIFHFCSSGLQVEGDGQDNPLEHAKKLLEIICQWEIKLYHYFTYQRSLVFFTRSFIRWLHITPGENSTWGIYRWSTLTDSVTLTLFWNIEGCLSFIK